MGASGSIVVGSWVSLWLLWFGYLECLLRLGLQVCGSFLRFTIPTVPDFSGGCLGRGYVIRSPKALSLVESFGLWTQREVALFLERVSWLPSR